MNFNKVVLVLLLVISAQAQAIVIELGLTYGFSKKSFNATNYYQSETKTASLSFYLFEKIALELSYTDSFYENQDQDREVDFVEGNTGADGCLLAGSQLFVCRPDLLVR